MGRTLLGTPRADIEAWRARVTRSAWRAGAQRTPAINDADGSFSTFAVFLFRYCSRIKPSE
jgi:hypothetical protein